MKIPPKADPPPAENTKTKKNMQYHTPIPRSIKNLGFLLTVLLFSGLIVTIVNAALTFTGTTIESDGPLSVIFEGATADDFETTLAVTDPTADRTITFPNQTGNVLLFANTNTQDQNIIFEGATADDFETTLAVIDPTADRTITFPDSGGTVVLNASDLQFAAGTPRIINIAQSSSGNAGAALSITGTQGGSAASGGNGQAGGSVSITGGAGTALSAGADGDGGDVVLQGGSRGGSSAQQGIVRVGSPSISSTRATDLLAVGGALEVDGATRFDGAVTLAGGNITINAGRKIAHASVTSGAHGVNFSMIGILTSGSENISTGATMGVIPANANITGVRVLVLTAFAGTGLADGDNYIDCGPSGSLTAYVTLVGVASNNVLTNRLFYITASNQAANFGDVGASDVTVQCRHQGANLTAGNVQLIIDYVID